MGSYVLEVEGEAPQDFPHFVANFGQCFFISGQKSA